MDFTATSSVNAAIRFLPMLLPRMIIGFRDAIRLLRLADSMFKLDLSDEFFHLPVRADQCPLLGFRHPISQRYYAYRLKPTSRSGSLRPPKSSKPSKRRCAAPFFVDSVSARLSLPVRKRDKALARLTSALASYRDSGAIISAGALH